MENSAIVGRNYCKE